MTVKRRNGKTKAGRSETTVKNGVTKMLSLERKTGTIWIKTLRKEKTKLKSIKVSPAIFQKRTKRGESLLMVGETERTGI